MVAKKGFTLIELLIVVTILSVLAGAAVPYVQDYLEDSRIARAKTDLEEIKGALQRYELTRGIPYGAGDVASLVGPFLSRSLTDPWGAPYVIATSTSQVISKGGNGQIGGGDDVAESFRPRMAISQVLWIDTNQNGVVDTGDSLNLRATRPMTGATLSTLANNADFAITGVGTLNAYSGASPVNNDRVASYGISAANNNPFTPGSDTVTIKVAGGLKDAGGNACLLDTLKITTR